MTITEYINLPRKSICLFLNRKSDEMYLGYSLNTFNTVTDNLKKFKDGLHQYQQMNNDGLEFHVLESFDDYKGNVLGRYRLSYWISRMTRNGYKILNKPKVAKVTPKVIVTAKHYDRGLRATVFCITERYEKYKVKEFKLLHEAEDFIKVTPVDDLLKIATKK